MPFPVNEANRVAAKDMQKLFAGRTFQYYRRWSGWQQAPTQMSRGQPAPSFFERIITVDVRYDGSLLLGCSERLDASAASFQTCARMAPDVAGSTENGVWRIDGGLFCWKHSRIRNAEEVCVSVHRQGSRYAAKLARGPWTCLEGELLFK
jgi:hypothetical protein